MKKGRSTYTFQLTCNPSLVNNLIQSYMNANGFKQETKNNEVYYKAGDSMIGYRCFNYSIATNNLTITAWLPGALGDVEIEQNGLMGMNIQVMNYRNSLTKLFQEISKLNSVETNINNNANQNSININNQMNFEPMTEQSLNQSTYQQPPQNNTNQFTQTFQDETAKKQEKMCEIGFWLSLFGLLCSFMGVTYGVIIYIMNFYFASQGLKTKKKGKAKATIVISVISILIIILQLMTL